MIANIAYTLVFGKPVIAYLGVLTLLSLYFTATISILNTRGIHFIPFKWHPRLAVITLILATIHGIFGLSVYLGF